MEDQYLYIVSGIISLVIVRKVLLLNSSERPNKLKYLDIASYTIAGLLIIAMLHTQNEISFLIMLGMVCIPFTVMIYSQYYREDRRRFVYSVSLTIAFVILVWGLHIF